MIVEQDIHVIDICNWVLGAHPIKAVATGGRKVISHAGDNWDNYEVAYTYPDDVHFNLFATQFGTFNWFDVSERVLGSIGMAEMPYSGPMRIIGENAWNAQEESQVKPEKPAQSFAQNGVFSNNLADADREKDRAFVESIVSGNFHNQIATGVESALSAMLGRMAARHGREVTWDELLSHGEKYSLNMDLRQFK